MGHRVSVLTTDAFDAEKRFMGPSIETLNDVTVMRATNVSNQLAYRQLFLPVNAVRLLTTLNSVDVVHMHGHRHLLNNVALKYAQNNGCPSILTANGTLRRIESKQRIKWLWDQFISGHVPKSVSACVTVSASDTSIHRSLGIPGDKIFQIPNGLDLNEFEALPEFNQFRRNFGLDDRPIIGFLGRISPRKGVDILIRAFRRIAPKAQLVIAGNDMGGLGEAKKAARDHPDIHFVGTLEGQQRLELLRDTNVLVYASQNEIFGLVPFEGLLCGAPVVVSDDCGCGEIIQKAQAGLLVPYGDAEGLSERLEILLSDPTLAQTMVNRGKSYIKRTLGFPQVAERHVELYEQLLQNQG
jgi:glycosyltransferase involved in cell wall biosynthesis